MTEIGTEGHSPTGRIIVTADAEIAHLIPEYVESVRADAMAMRIALDANDFDQVRIFGHGARGSGGSYGFEGITRLGAAIELAALQGDGVQLRRKLDELDDYLTRLVVIYP